MFNPFAISVSWQMRATANFTRYTRQARITPGNDYWHNLRCDEKAEIINCL